MNTEIDEIYSHQDWDGQKICGQQQPLHFLQRLSFVCFLMSVSVQTVLILSRKQTHKKTTKSSNKFPIFHDHHSKNTAAKFPACAGENNQTPHTGSDSLNDYWSVSVIWWAARVRLGSVRWDQQHDLMLLPPPDGILLYNVTNRTFVLQAHSSRWDHKHKVLDSSFQWTSSFLCDSQVFTAGSHGGCEAVSRPQLKSFTAALHKY